MSVVDRSYDHPMKLEERATAPLAGGILQQGYQCGMLWGAALAAGAQAYRLYGPTPQAETAALMASQRLVETFRARNKHIDCFEIVDFKWKQSSQRPMIVQVLKFFLRGGPVLCFSMAARYAQAALRETNSAYSERPLEAPVPPVSCAAVLARKMGLSDMHAVMAAGFAGGIGLSGGGCGALGAAIWIIGMQDRQNGVENAGFENPRSNAALETFLETSDYEFECSKIVGRKFASPDEHSEYVRNGGCAKIIEALAAG